MSSRVRYAGVFIVIGLAVQMLTLNHVHPLAFIVFLALGATSVGIGATIFLSVFFTKEAGS